MVVGGVFDERDIDGFDYNVSGPECSRIPVHRAGARALPGLTRHSLQYMELYRKFQGNQ